MAKGDPDLTPLIACVSSIESGGRAIWAASTLPPGATTTGLALLPIAHVNIGVIRGIAWPLFLPPVFARTQLFREPDEDISSGGTSRATGNPINAVTLNPEKEAVVNAALATDGIAASAARSRRQLR